MATAAIDQEARIAELENRLKYAGYNDRARAQMIEIEAKEGLLAEKRAESIKREKEYAIERGLRINSEIVSMVKTGRLRLEVEGRRVSGIKEPVVSCGFCKKPLHESTGLLLSAHEQIGICGPNDGIMLQKAGAVFWHTGFTCQNCGQHNTVRMQYVLLD